MSSDVGRTAPGIACQPWSGPSRGFDPFTSSPGANQPLNQTGSMADSTFLEMDDPTYMLPSYEYDNHRQQTGLPPHSLHQAVSSDEGYMNFNPTLVPGFPHGLGSSDAASSSFVNPCSLVNPPGSTYRKVYPGMHQEMAKEAEAQRKRQQEMQLQQQQEQAKLSQHMQSQMHEQERAQVDQRMLMQEETQKQQSSHPPNASAKSNEAADRIFNQIKQTASAIVMHQRFPDPRDRMPHANKAKKTLDDMDEDERKLASEKAKEMEPKARRQLRNKVSARAFRSRRKGN